MKSERSTWTDEKVMFYARDRFGLSGEATREFPSGARSYPLSPDLARIVGRLLTNGHIEARTKVTHVPETRGTGFLDCAAHVLTSTTYHATDAGLTAWVKGTL